MAGRLAAAEAGALTIMEIGRIKGATRTLGAPKDWNADRDGPCIGLPIRDERHGGQPCMESEWYPTPSEIAAMAFGQPVKLRVLGTVHPPVALYV